MKDLDARALAANVETIFGTVKEIDHCSKTLTIRVLLGCDNLPEYVLGKLGPNELLQINATLVVPCVTMGFDLSASVRAWLRTLTGRPALAARPALACAEAQRSSVSRPVTATGSVPGHGVRALSRRIV